MLTHQRRWSDLLQVSGTNCRKLIQLVRMPIAINTARPIGKNSRLLFFKRVDISFLR
jgi:hypothetical protein